MGFKEKEGKQETSFGEVEGSISKRVNAKALQDDLQSLGFILSQAKPEMGKEVGRLRARS